MFRLTALIYTVAAIAIIVLMAMRPPVDVGVTTDQATTSTADTSEKAQSATATDVTEEQVSTETSTSTTATGNTTSTEVQENNAIPVFPTEVTPASETPTNTPETNQAPAPSTEVTPAQAVEEAANKEKEAVAGENNTATQPAETSTTPEAANNVIDTPLDALTDEVKKNLK